MWPTRAAARSTIFEYVEACHNRQHHHFTLGYVSAATIEQWRFAQQVVSGTATVAVA